MNDEIQIPHLANNVSPRAHRPIANGGAVKPVRIHARDKVLRGRQTHGAIRIEQRVDLAIATPLRLVFGERFDRLRMAADSTERSGRNEKNEWPDWTNVNTARGNEYRDTSVRIGYITNRGLAAAPE